MVPSATSAGAGHSGDSLLSPKVIVAQDLVQQNNPLHSVGAVGNSFWKDVVGGLFPWEFPGRATQTVTDLDILGVLLPWEFEQKNQLPRAAAGFCGVGIIFRRHLSGALLVHQLVRGGAAASTCILEGDELLEVDDVVVHKRPLSEVSLLILGKRGTIVWLELYRRADGQRLRVGVVRAENPVLVQGVIQDDLLRAPNRNVHVVVPGNLTALHTVVMLASHSGENAVEEVSGLLIAGHDVNARDADGCTPIFFASGSVPTMQILLSHEAEVNITNRLGNSPLHYAAAGNSVVCMEMLVHAGADRSVRSSIGLTPQQLASSLRKDEAAGFLHALDARAQHGVAFRPLPASEMPLNQQLLFAVSDEGPLTDALPVSVLLDAGADPNVQEDQTGMYVLHLAVLQQSTATVRALLRAGAEPCTAAVAGSLIDRQITIPPLILRELLESPDCDINAEIFMTGNVVSLLHLAVMKEDFAATKLLIEEGADLSRMDQHGQTPEELANGGFLVHVTPSTALATLFSR